MDSEGKTPSSAEKAPIHEYVAEANWLHHDVHEKAYGICHDQIVYQSKSVQDIIIGLTSEIDKLGESLELLAPENQIGKITIEHAIKVAQNTKQIYAMLHGEKDERDSDDSTDSVEIINYIIDSSRNNDLLEIKENIDKLGTKADTIIEKYEMLDKELQAFASGQEITPEQKKAYELLHSKQEAFLLLDLILRNGHGDKAFQDILEYQGVSGRETQAEVIEKFFDSVKNILLSNPEFKQAAAFKNHAADLESYTIALINTIKKGLEDQFAIRKNTSMSFNTIQADLQLLINQIGKADLHQYISFALNKSLLILQPIIDNTVAIEGSSSTTTMVESPVKTLLEIIAARDASLAHSNATIEQLKGEKGVSVEALRLAQAEQQRLLKNVLTLGRELGMANSDNIKLLGLVATVPGLVDTVGNMLRDLNKFIKASPDNMNNGDIVAYQQWLEELSKMLKKTPPSRLLVQSAELSDRLFKPFRDIVDRTKDIIDQFEYNQITQENKIKMLLDVKNEYKALMRAIDRQSDGQLYERANKLYVSHFL